MGLILLVCSCDCSGYGGHFPSFQVYPDGVWKYEEEALKYEEKWNPLIVVVLFDTVVLFSTVILFISGQDTRGGIKFGTVISIFSIFFIYIFRFTLSRRKKG